MSLYLMMLIAIFLLFVMIASFIGNEENDSFFWRIIFRIRRILDLFSYILFNLIAFAGICKALIDLFRSPPGDALSILMELIGISLLSFVLVYSIYQWIKDK